MTPEDDVLECSSAALDPEDHRTIMATSPAVSVLTTFLVIVTCCLTGVEPGINTVSFTKTMMSRATWQDPTRTGLRDFPVFRQGIAVTNSDTDFNFWYQESGTSTEAVQNNLVYRYFICKLDDSVFGFCGDAPNASSPYNPTALSGGFKRSVTLCLSRIYPPPSLSIVAFESLFENSFKFNSLTLYLA